jgi:hypothetical protein
MTTGPLTLDDIADQRAYERERDQFRAQVIAVKKLRRISIGPVVTVTFESRLTMRFQVQEMARTERMVSDEQIQHELDVYNRLVPSPGELSATLFLELTSEEELRTWLPRLVGIETACELRIGTGASAEAIVSTPEEEHQANLTRAATTSAVHYVRFHFTEAQSAAFARPGVEVRLVVNHPEYPDGLPGEVLSEATRHELATDLTGG